MAHQLGKRPEPADNTENELEDKARDSRDEDLSKRVTARSNHDFREEVPEFHGKTWLALAALLVLNFVQVVALTGPPAVLDYIGDDLDHSAIQTWIPNALSLVQAVGGPIVAYSSDVFQARKGFLVIPTAVSFIGACVAATASSIYVLIVAQILIGFGFSIIPLAYCIPSEILPRRWRPLAQSTINIAASLGSISGPLVAGKFVEHSVRGWQKFYWVQAGLWAFCSLALFVGYRPAKRVSKNGSLTLSAKIRTLDLPGVGLLTAGLTLLLAGLSLGKAPWPWSNARVVVPLALGAGLLVAFGVYEWKIKTGILHRDLFAGGPAFGLCIALMFIEGVMLFATIVFYPALTTALYEPNPFLTAARCAPFFIASGISTTLYGYFATRTRRIIEPLFVGFLVMAAGLAGLASLQPDSSTRAIIFDALAGVGFAGPLILLISACQLATPPELIATATAILTSTRAASAAFITAVYAAILSSKLEVNIPTEIAGAVGAAGLPPTSIPEFIEALLSKNSTALMAVPGNNPEIVAAGLGGLLQALADSFRWIYVTGACFAAPALVLVWFLRGLREKMDYKVDAPIEKLVYHQRNRDAAFKA